MAEDFFEDLLKDEPELSEEEKRKKNKDAEEARKRREAEEKAKKEAEEKAKAEAEEKAKAEAEEKARLEAEQKKRSEQTQKLGDQLIQFKKAYPDVDLQTLDKDANFKNFIDGKLLGKKDFKTLYEDYLNLTSSISGKTADEIKKIHQIKAGSSTGTSTPQGTPKVSDDVYSREELDRLTRKLPLMSDAEAKKIMAKFDKSVEFYKKNKGE